MMPIQSLDREVETRLRDRDVRYTRGRRVVVAALNMAEGPMSAAELHQQIGSDLPLSSLYRTLSVLEEAGVVMPHYGPHAVTRFELAEWLTGHHHHLVCVECGTVDDIDVPQPYEDEVRRLVDEIAEMASFDPSGHVLEIEGRCSRCR